MEPTRPESIFNVQPAPGDRAVLAFSHRGSTSFAFYSLLKPLEQTKVFLRDPNDDWYSNGLPDIAGGLPGLCVRLQQITSELKLKRVGAIGASMGGYGAILVGATLGIDRVLALVPQTLLDKRFPLSPENMSAYRYADLRPLVAAAARTNIDIVIGQNDLMDAYYASRLASLENVRVFQVPGTAHLVTQTLHERGQLYDCIRAWNDGQVSANLQPAPHLRDPAVSQALEELAQAIHGGELRNGLRSLDAIRSLVPNWPGALFTQGIIELKAGNPDHALATLSQCADITPDWAEVYFHLARAHFRTGDLGTAIQIVGKSLALNPSWAEANYDLGNYHEKAGRFEEALAAFGKAAQIKPKWSEPGKRILSLKNSLGMN